MSGIRDKWNARYSGRVPEAHNVSQVLRDYAHLLPADGIGLDFACGLGSDALFLAERGLSVVAWDISDVAISILASEAKQRDLDVDATVLDLENSPWPEQRFDVVMVSHYLNRSQCHHIANLLKPRGLLFYQTFTAQKTADAKTPNRPDFLLGAGELLQLFPQLQPVVYSDQGLIGDTTKGFRNQAFLIAQRGQ